MSELKNGQEVYVSETSERQALENRALRTFICTRKDGRFVCETDKGRVSVWKYAVPVPKPKIIPWTFEACPLPPFTVRSKRRGNYFTVDAVVSGVDEDNPVYIAELGAYSFGDLLARWDYIPDRNDRDNILPCGSEE